MRRYPINVMAPLASARPLPGFLQYEEAAQQAAAAAEQRKAAKKARRKQAKAAPHPEQPPVLPDRGLNAPAPHAPASRQSCNASNLAKQRPNQKLAVMMDSGSEAAAEQREPCATNDQIALSNAVRALQLDVANLSREEQCAAPQPAAAVSGTVAEAGVDCRISEANNGGGVATLDTVMGLLLQTALSTAPADTSCRDTRQSVVKACAEAAEVPPVLATAAGPDAAELDLFLYCPLTKVRMPLLHLLSARVVEGKAWRS